MIRKIKSRSPRLTNASLVSFIDPLRINFNGSAPMTPEEYEAWAERQTAQYHAYHERNTPKPFSKK